MGQDQSLPSDGRATTAQEFVEALTGGKFADDATLSAAFDPNELIPGVDSFTADQVNKLHDFLTEQISSLRKQLTALSKNKNAGFMQQFQGLTAGNGNAANHSRARGNERLNRYMNIVAYDHCRVSVTPNQMNLNNDYINASWIPGATGPKHYIATQGPVPDSMASFWQMIWEYNAHVIVMVTNEVETGKLKCHRYWPDPTEGTSPTAEHGEVTVTYVDQTVHATFVTRRFTIRRGSETRDLVQYAYTGWPDHGVPATTREMINFRRCIKEEYLKHEGPLVVHCSAGVGRTGTFIGLDRFLDSCLKCESTTVLQIVEDMRYHRNFMVQSPIQFVYLYLACLDGVERILALTKKAQRYLTMTAEEKHEEQLAEVAAALEKEEQAFNTLKQKQKQQKPSAQNVFEEPETSATKTATQGANEATARLPSLERRKEALESSKESWQRNYSDAQRRWLLERDENGEVYNIEQTMAPMQSRLAALAAAQSAYEHRATGDAHLAELKENIASVQNRLESLCVFVYGDSWKQRGHGFRGKEVKPHIRAHTVEMLGTLQNRLEMLSRDTVAWVEREVQAAERYTGPETFEKEVQTQRSLQEAEMKQRILRQQQEEEMARQREQEALHRELQVQQQNEAERLEQAQRQQVKDRFKQAGLVPVKQTYDPARIRSEKQRQAEMEELQKQQEEAARLAAEQEKQEKLQAEQTKKEEAAKKASRFLSKLRK
eukprot:m.100729 g.100729  ORF g.100729 m.100729 type:complete len:717 (+) comp14951_c0_seq1:167-2317(+)